MSCLLLLGSHLFWHLKTNNLVTWGGCWPPMAVMWDWCLEITSRSLACDLLSLRGETTSRSKVGSPLNIFLLHYYYTFEVCFLIIYLMVSQVTNWWLLESPASQSLIKDNAQPWLHTLAPLGGTMALNQACHMPSIGCLHQTKLKYR